MRNSNSKTPRIDFVPHFLRKSEKEVPPVGREYFDGYRLEQVTPLVDLLHVVESHFEAPEGEDKTPSNWSIVIICNYLLQYFPCITAANEILQEVARLPTLTFSSGRRVWRSWVLSAHGNCNDKWCGWFIYDVMISSGNHEKLNKLSKKWHQCCHIQRLDRHHREDKMAYSGGKLSMSTMSVTSFEVKRVKPSTM